MKYLNVSLMIKVSKKIKAELLQVGIFSSSIYLHKLEIEETKTT